MLKGNSNKKAARVGTEFFKKQFKDFSRNFQGYSLSFKDMKRGVSM